MRLQVVTALVLLLVAGCTAPAAPPPGPSAVFPALPPSEALVTFDGAGRVLATPASAVRGLELLPTGLASGEPSIGALKDGTLFVGGMGVRNPTTTDDQVARSRDGGRTWDIVGARTQPGPLDLDPWIFVDQVTGRLYNAPLYVVCSNVAWSDDAGVTWTDSHAAGCGLPAHDHQKLTAGPPPGGVQTQGYPHVLYYGYNSLRPAGGIPQRIPTDGTTGALREGTAVSVSLDGGATWGLPVVVYPPDPCHAGVMGPVAVDADGTAMFAKPTCAGTAILASRDAGKTWATAQPFDAVGGFPDFVLDSMVNFDTAGNAYAATVGKDGASYLAVSRDHGATWAAPVRASPPGINATAFLVAAVGAPGHVAIATIASASPAWSSRAPSVAPPGTVWHLWFTFSDDALAASPTFTSQRATPADDPVQVGCIWLRGGANDCRNLGDFIGIATLEGRTYVVYTDGCDKCPLGAQSTGFSGVLAVVQTGTSLRGEALAPLNSSR